jgi:hypothetical protein
MKIKKIFSSETTWPFGIKVCKNDVCEILIGKKTLKIYSETVGQLKPSFAGMMFSWSSTKITNSFYFDIAKQSMAIMLSSWF